MEKILGLKSSAKSNSPTIKENGNCTVKAIIDEIKMHQQCFVDVPIHPAVEMFFDLQAHLKEHMTHVNNEQVSRGCVKYAATMAIDTFI